MKSELLPVNEIERQKALDEYGILDTPDEQALDDITRLTAQVCEVPIALISLVDRERQWFKSKLGLSSVCQTPREGGFCAHAILNYEVMEISDASRDERFHDHPFVTGDPKIRFYAGAPLVTQNGFALGTLCVIDSKPRQLSAWQREVLQELARIVMALFETRRLQQKLRDSDKERLRMITDNMPALIAYIDTEQRYRFNNQTYQEWFGKNPAELYGCTTREIIGELAYERVRPYIEAALAGKRTSFDQSMPRKGGGVRHVMANYIPHLDENRKVLGAYILAHDISARKIAEDALARERELAQVTLASIGDGVITTDDLGLVTYLNRVAEQLTGWSSPEAQGVPLADVLHLAHRITREPLTLEPIPQMLAAGRVCEHTGEALLLARGGQEHFIEEVVSPIQTPQGHSLGVVLVLRDVSRAREMAERLSYQASHDPLTDLANRREFERCIEVLLESSRATHKHHALLYMDLDQFKVVNDTCGHLAGDELLRQIANVLLSRMRKSDTLARLGGDEFGVLLEGCTPEQAQRVAQQLVETVRDFRFVWEGRRFTVSASIGLAAITEYSEDMKSLLSAADSACFIAKDQGRNRVQVFAYQDTEVRRRHGEMDWLARINHAFEEDRFCMYFQKIAPVTRDRAAGEHYEFLLRLRDEKGLIVPPAAFIPAAERYNLMPVFDRWVVHTLFQN
ncbi:MAG: diguanylate cyclase domain-containing protein, partial [Burkholderiales bacterium]